MKPKSKKNIKKIEPHSSLQDKTDENDAKPYVLCYEIIIIRV